MKLCALRMPLKDTFRRSTSENMASSSMNNINPCERIFQHPLPHRKKIKTLHFFFIQPQSIKYSLFPSKRYCTLYIPGKSLLEESMVTPMKSTINLLKSSPLLSFYVPFPLLNPSRPMIAQCPANWPWSDHFDDVSRLRRNLFQTPLYIFLLFILTYPFLEAIRQGTKFRGRTPESGPSFRYKGTLCVCNGVQGYTFNSCISYGKTRVNIPI